jgi:hypothetical protein
MANDTLQADLEIGGVDQALEGFKRKMSDGINDLKIGSGFSKGISKGLDESNQKAKQLTSSLKDVVGTFGFAVGASALVGGTLKFLNDSKNASLENVKAYRLLASTATEAGKAQADLIESNEKFAQSASLSKTESAGLVSKIQQLATFSGKPQNFEPLAKSFLDLGAAKGINGADLQNLIGTILSGQDEGLNRLGLPDPSKIYEAYGKQIGVTGDKLNQFQKVQAAANAVMEKAATFTGANADRLESMSGKSETASAQIKNLYTNFGDGLTNSLEFQNALKTINDLLESVTTNVPKVRAALKDGITPKQLAEKESEKGVNQFLDVVSDLGTSIGATVLFPYDAITKGFDEAVNLNINSGIGSSKKLRIDALTRQFTIEEKDVKTQLDKAGEEAGKLTSKTFVASFDSTVDGLLNSGSKGLEKTKVTLGDAVKLQKELNDHLAEIGGKGSEQAKAAQLKVDQVYRAAINSALEFKKTMAAFNSNAVDQYVAYGKARIAADNAGEDGDRIKVIREQTELEQLAIKEKIRLQKEFNKEQLKGLSPDELKGEKGKTLALENTEKLNKLIYEAEILRLETQTRINEEIEKEQKKAEELRKTYKSTLADLSRKISPNNPFVSVFLEADKALEDLRENLKKLPPEM